jgi:hypothetical protein
MNAVIVAGRQVERDKSPVLEGPRPLGASAEQFQCAVIMTFGLDDTSAVNGAQLADDTVDRGGDGLEFVRDRTQFRPDGAREEGIEGGVAFDILLDGLGHIDSEAAYKPADGGVLQPGAAAGQEIDDP